MGSFQDRVPPLFWASFSQCFLHLLATYVFIGLQWWRKCNLVSYIFSSPPPVKLHADTCQPPPQVTRSKNPGGVGHEYGLYLMK